MESTLTSSRLALLGSGQGEAVQQWRFDRLCKAGYAPRDAVRLAADPMIDLHRAVRLMERGCPVDTALRILL